MAKRIISLTIAFILLTLVFWIVEFFWPSVPGQRRLRRGWPTDLIYWFFTAFVTNAVAQLAILAALVPLLLLLGRSLDRAAVEAGHGWVITWPVWLQAVTLVVLGDFIGYWTHRAFHGRRMWRFHAVHHSSKELDWLSSVRVHPIDEILSRVCKAVPFVLCGFSPVVIAGYLPFLTFYAIFIHANVSWSFGPLRYIIATPLLHRWHHTKEDEAIDKNFAGFLPLWDMIFGTFYMPKDKVPSEFGVHDDSVPEGFLAQLSHPFRPRRVE